MVHIQKGPAPQALIQAKRLHLTCYDEMDTATKTAIKEDLLSEQYHLCAYCMRRIHLDTMQIEHYLAQNPEDDDYDPASTIDYHNMLGVCPGGKETGCAYKSMTCDAHRKNIKLTVDPLNQVSISKISYLSDGTITSSDSNINHDLQNTLNLNCAEARLKENRKSALDAVKSWVHQNYPNKTVTKAVWKSLYEKYCLSPGPQKKPYIGIIEWYLKKKSL